MILFIILLWILAWGLYEIFSIWKESTRNWNDWLLYMPARIFMWPYLLWVMIKK